MKVRLAFALLLFADLALPAPAWGQEVAMPDGKELPKEIKQDSEGNDPLVWVAYQGYKPKHLPGPQGQEVPYERDGQPTAIKFMESFFAATPRYGAGDAEYRLLVRVSKDGKRITQYVGWADVRFLVSRPEALENEHTRIHIKAMIVNRPQALGSGGEGKVLKRVPIYYAPDPQAPTAEPIQLFNIFFAYGDTDPGKEDKGYLLLGRSPTFLKDVPKDPEHVVLGWAPKGRVCQWDTREAFEWDVPSTQPDAQPKRRTSPGRVYHNQQDAHAALERKNRPWMFQETFANGVSVPMAAAQMRFPVLPWKDHKDPEKYPQVLSAPDRGPNELRRVGVYGGFLSEAGEEVLPSPEIEDLRGRLGRAEQEASKTQVLFVIDDTASMVAWFPRVAEVFDEVLASVKDSKRPVELAVAYYNDILSADMDPDTAVITHKLADFTAEGGTIADELRNHKPHDGGDPPEQVFRGLIKGIEAAGFSPYARKLVVLIGDMGNNAKYDTDPNKRKPSEEWAAERLNPADQSPLEFYAIQVVNPDKKFDTAEEADAARAFQAQMQKILELSEGHLRARKFSDRIPGKYVTLADTDQVKRMLKGRFKYLEGQGKKVSEGFGELSLGRFTTEIGPEMEFILKEYNIDLKKLKDLKGAQVFEFGYVWVKSPEGVPQLRPRLLVSQNELDRVIEVLKSLESRDPARKKLPEVIQHLIATQANEHDYEKIKGKSVEDVVLRGRGLAFKSDLLRTALQNMKDVRVTRQELQNVLKRMRLLEDVRGDKRYRYRSSTQDVAGIEVEVWERDGDPAELKGRDRRSFYIGGDRTVIWYWIDFTEEWP